MWILLVGMERNLDLLQLKMDLMMKTLVSCTYLRLMCVDIFALIKIQPDMLGRTC